MVIRIDRELACASYRDEASGASQCGKQATAGFITPVEDGAWELLPVCAVHLQEARDLARYTAMAADAAHEHVRPADGVLAARTVWPADVFAGSAV